MDIRGNLLMKRILAGALAATLVSVSALAADTKTLLNQSNTDPETVRPASTKQTQQVEATADMPVLSKKSDTTAAAVAYEYHPFDPDYSGIYINEFYCDSSRLMITADDGKSYLVTDPTPFTDGSLTCTLRYVANVQMIKSMKVAGDDQRRGVMPAYVMRLSDNAILDDIVAAFSTAFTAPQDMTITVRDASNVKAKPVKMLLKSGASILIRHRMEVSYDRLNKLQFTPKYDVDFDSLTHDGAAGIESDVMYPTDDYENSSADYCWESLGRICAEIDYSGSQTPSYVPKLSTFWSDGDTLKKFSNTKAYIRDFGGANLKATVRLTITNPFLTFDGDEVVPHGEIVIYEYTDKHLKDVTSKFRYSKNTDGDGAFVTATSQLGTYILSEKKVR